MKRVLVTGGTGFIGRHLVNELLRRELAVKALIRTDQPPQHLRDRRIECVAGDLGKLDPLRHAAAGVDTVIHLAGQTHAISRAELDRTNRLGSGRLADACLAQNSPPRVIYVSSLAAAGPTGRGEPPRREDQPCQPVSDYGHSKRLGEIEMGKRADRLPVTVIRPGIVLGPYDRNAVPMFRSIYRQRLHLVVGLRSPALSIIGVGDLVELIIRAAENGQRLRGESADPDCSQGYYFACDDREYPTYAQLGRKIAATLDRRVLVWPLWRWVGRSIAATSQSASRLRGKSTILNLDKIREATVDSWACSSEKARTELGFVPAQSIDQWIELTAAWYRNQGWLDGQISRSS